MRVASHTLAFNINNFLPNVIDNATPFVDKVFVALPARPWAYNKNMRDRAVNPTTIDHFRAANRFDKIEFIHGDWETDEQTRNACLAAARQQGFDWLITQDADEFYTERSWTQAITALSKADSSVDCFKTTWFNFWKSAQYIVQYDHGSIKDANVNFAIRCDSDVHFRYSRSSTVKNPTLLDTPCFHFGYVLSDDDMRLKIKTWAHTKEFNPDLWFSLKWLLWHENAKNLYPMHPTFWRQAIRTPFELPDFAQVYASSLEGHQVLDILQFARELGYDTKHQARESLKQLRNRFRAGPRLRR